MMPQREQNKYGFRWAAVLLLLLFWGRLLDAAAYNAPTLDEVLHTYHGVLYWRRVPAKMPRNITNNPPLVNAVIGLPVNLAAWPRLPVPAAPAATAEDTVTESQTFMWELNDNGLQLIWLGRLGVMFLSLLAGGLIFHWGRRLFGGAAALAALFLFTFDPNILAHAGLATLDLGTAFFMLLAAFLVWRYWRRPGRAAWFLAGVGIGLALAAKFSGVIVIPAVILISFYRLWRLGRLAAEWRRVAALLAGWLLLAAVTFLAVYRFDLVMLQADYVWQKAHQLEGHPGVFLGQISREGWRYYFPVLFAVKTPLAFLLLLAGALGLFVTRRRYDWERLFLLLTAAGVGGASLLTRVNIGYRYLLPALPFLFLFTAQLAQPGYVRARAGRWAATAAAGWLLVSSLLIRPQYLAYFNALAGGPENGWRVAADSNIEWGQDLAALGNYLASRHIAGVRGAWFSIVPPEIYGINLVEELYHPTLPPELEEQFGDFYPPRPAPGVYVFGATFLQGFQETPATSRQWFRERPPNDKVGYSLFVYDVPAEGEPAGLALAGIGLSAIPPADFDRAFAGNNVTPRWYDARFAFLWPGGGGETAWAAVADAYRPEHPALQSFYPAGPFLRGEGNSQFTQPLPYSLYRLDAPPEQTAATRAGFRADAGWSPQPVTGADAWAAERRPLAEPAVFSDTLAFLGYEMWGEAEPLRPGGTVEMLTYWRAADYAAPDLKIFIHLLDGAGNVVAQNDGLALLSGKLRPGDEFVQLHAIQLPADLPPGLYGWQLGVYNEKSGERLRLLDGAADRLLLHTVESADVP